MKDTNTKALTGKEAAFNVWQTVFNKVKSSPEFSDISKLARKSMIVLSGVHQHKKKYLLNGLFMNAMLCICFSAYPQSGNTIPARQNGEMDIYQLSTGMGNACFIIMPDGTNLLIDAGAVNRDYKRKINPVPRPDDSKPAGQRIADFVAALIPANRPKKIDYFLLTHFHDDHMGYPDSLSPFTPDSTYQLSGITALGTIIPIQNIIDRGWPDYNFPDTINNRMVNNYRKFITEQIAQNKTTVSRFIPGSDNQLKMLYRPASVRTAFCIENIIGNGIMLDTGKRKISLFPKEQITGKTSFINENNSSCGIKISYGNFSFYSAGDLIGIPISQRKEDSWQNFETPAANSAGKITVLVAGHHGYKDALATETLLQLQPSVIIFPAWASGHPDSAVLKRIQAFALANHQPLLLSISLIPEDWHISNKGLFSTLFADTGHIMIRVSADGNSYRIFILDDNKEGIHLKKEAGTFKSW